MPGVPWPDAVVVAVLAPLAVVEGLVREVPWRSVSIVAAVVVVLLVAGRRTHPFVVFCAAFSIVIALNLVAAFTGVAGNDLYVNAAILLLPYSLFRWGAGREAAVGLGIMAFVYASSAATDGLKDVPEAIGAGVVFLMPAVLGATVRFRATAQERTLETARARERERLARDLHDTVAHHVTAIVLQAQAGRLYAREQPDVAERCLAVIEAEAARALAELRTLVGVLRESDLGNPDAPLLPAPCLSDVEQLTRASSDGRVVEVSLAGDLQGLSPAVETAVFRIAQEAVTNALRHARAATRVLVRVDRGPAGVRVSVTDDGRASSSSSASSAGYGLVGMAERATLLGGTFRAGPRAGGGWQVEALLPTTPTTTTTTRQT